MQLFYTNEVFSDNRAVLRDTEWDHCRRVLRYQEGDHVQFVDGSGGLYEGVLQTAGKKEGVIRVVKKTAHWKQRPYHVHIAIAPTKQMNRMEWMLEKLIEIGVDRVTFLDCSRSERRVVKLDRLEKIAVSAMKQSLQAKLPGLGQMVPFERFIQSAPGGTQKYIAHLDESSTSIEANYICGNDVIILIGPEGDFDEEEIRLAKEHGFLSVHLGQNRLRTETAGLCACHTIHVINQEI